MTSGEGEAAGGGGAASRGTNELVFRDANERIDESRRRLGFGARTPYLCECESERCMELIALMPDEYERVRSGRERFVLRTGHAIGSAPVVEQGDGFVIVERQEDR